MQVKYYLTMNGIIVFPLFFILMIPIVYKNWNEEKLTPTSLKV